ncbi:flagellar motility protein MotE (MotC chaperone) [Bacillus ectoiniformans]|uniref:MotE family protein n=1 Tax=Bacillus ectoiniformans TaxID=1494429 RepID=UPI0019571FC3|nr:MotE family protein [Bacillus ectoiniformans]MBM7647129.1 flagellar motility protein MotE (MotC chaperone) [Bacillus ectoiniformans]
MARKKKAIKKVESDEETKGYSTFQWILFVLIIPLLFALTIALIVMTVAGVNVFEKGKEISAHIPGLSSLTEKDEANQTGGGKADKEKVVELQTELADKEAEIDQLAKKLDASDQEIEKLLTEKDRLEVELEQLKNQEEGEAANTKNDNSIISTYETMAPKNIANILVNLSDNEAVGILAELETDKQADILEKLPPETAAKYTKLLSSSTP